MPRKRISLLIRRLRHCTMHSIPATLSEVILVNCGLLSPLLIGICMSPSLPVFAPPLHIPICTCSRNAEKKGALHAFDFIIVTVDILYMDIASYASVLLLIVPLVLTSLSHMLIYTAVFEFICSQSPHSMKGLLIGLLYAIKGLYQLLATLLVVPFAVGYSNHPFSLARTDELWVVLLPGR